MGYQVNYNGVDLSQYMGILKVNRSILPERKNFSKDIPSMFGEFYTGYKYAPKQIVLECFVAARSADEHVDALNIIADVLNVKYPSKLIISDEPEKYMWAVIEGGIDVEKKGQNGLFSIKFICYDPYLYSVEDYVYEGDDSKIITVESSGSIETFPRFGASFYKDAYFFQVTDYYGRTILLGNRPDADGNSKPTPFVFHDDCSLTSNWLASGNVLDAGYEVMGAVTVNGGNYALIPSDYGTSTNGWHGPAIRRNIGQDIKDFEVKIKVEHNSKGDVRQVGSTTKPPDPTPRDYYTASDVKLRQDRSASSVQLAVIPKGTKCSVSNIDKNFGQVTYKGKTGYVGMGYMTLTKPAAPTPSSSYTTTANLNLRSGRGTKYTILKVIPKGTGLTVTDIKDGWGKTSYGSKTGYVYTSYLKKVSGSSSSLDFAEAFSVPTPPSTENKLGRLEIYGFDRNGAKLFKLVARDSDYWYEYTQPEVFIGNTLVLDDKKSCPAPIKGYVKNPEDGKFVYQTIDSGRFGDWNEMVGYFTIKRTTNSKGKQVWYARVDKVVGESITRHIETKNISNTAYPTGDLNNIVVFFGQFKDNIVVDTMSVNDVHITDLTTIAKTDIKPIFKSGDELLIDCNTQEVTLNNKTFPITKELDVGSTFFSIPTGISQYICNTDDDTADVHATINDRWI